MSRRDGGLRFQTARTNKPALPTGKKQRLQIERVANDGRGIGFADGRTWFVSGALPGEQVEARVLSARAKVVEARAENILQASEHRRPLACAYASRCGGCSLQHMPHAQQLAFKQAALAEQFQRVAQVQPETWAQPLTGPELGYRRRARIAVRVDSASGKVQVGFREQASQAIISIEQCPVLVAPLQPLMAGLSELLNRFKQPRKVGHVELFWGDFAVLLLRHTAALDPADLAALRSYCEQHQAQLWLQGDEQPVADQSGPMPGYSLLDGRLRLAWQPGDFVQVNAQINEAMVSQALDWLNPQSEERVLDLFCGLGNFALPLALRSAQVVAVEGVAGMVERAALNAQANNCPNVSFHHADLAQPLVQASWAQGGFSAMLLDPPRDGAYELVAQVRSLGVKRVVYVSCNPATLARDTAVLVEQGFTLKRAGILDMFPQTGHIEAMALFEADKDVQSA